MILLALIVATIILLVIDYRQTLDIKHHPDIEEVNLILGKHPTDQRINSYFVIVIISLWIAVSLLPELYYLTLLLIICCLEVYITIANYRLGLKV